MSSERKSKAERWESEGRKIGTRVQGFMTRARWRAGVADGSRKTFDAIVPDLQEKAVGERPFRGKIMRRVELL